ncbi:phenylalanine--tRNA ligase subunit beta [Schumannella luteola]|uniref:Phenylalanine--tRNA ligase beta subunit n=1 Tax=Schumannella luteola TaxID=472059 RepID=A0A852YGH2_9MICO|nr:phenylalanine--tRNA ligase subunit beta [Schumannella luteola]NYH00242.1 phenylalanyl-tRNA synthetase beta chain [Schumannella luteola]TPX04013.1 phenylalanine--tRNA ligase subunit beta [Schumannella luteola]
MRIPLSWLRDWVALPEDATLEHVHAALVSVGFEEEDVHAAEVTGPVVVGQVLSLEPEPQKNGKTINWCQVDVGEAEPRGIVCGAHNFGVGDKVVVTLPGAVLPGPFPIAARKTYGHVSDGMIASTRELGLGDEHDGILRLVELGLDPEPGTDALALLGLDDAAVEINVTPDRGYAFSIRGVAREYSHATGASFRDPADAVEPVAAHGFPVTLDDGAPIRGRQGASVIAFRVVRGIDATRPTPSWMRSRLRLAGIRSISLAVDVTNYVMLELGQPIHGFDLGKISGGITLRRAQPGETLETLDAVTRKLDPQDLVVADESGAVALAGVMGGAATEISDATTDVLIEAINWDPISIARTARRHKLPSEAAKRLERGVDPRVTPLAAARVAQLLVELTGGTIDELGVDAGEAIVPGPIEFALDLPARIVGVDYTAEQVVSTLELIGATVVVQGQLALSSTATVTPPTWRPDLTDGPTLVEEVARIVGYGEIPSVLPVAPPGRGLTRAQRLRRGIAQGLADAGATEVQAYPFHSRAQIDAFTPAAAAVKLANALDGEAALLRRSLLPGLVDVARRNLGRGLTDLAIYEVGTVFLPESGRAYGTEGIPAGAARPSDAVLAELNDAIPAQGWRVGYLALGDTVDKQPGQAAVASGLSDALDAARQVALSAGAALEVVQGSHPALHPGRTAELRVAGTVVGHAGELLPALAAELDLPRVVAVTEIDVDALIELSDVHRSATPIRTQPAATQDLSLVVDAGVPAADVVAAVTEGAGELLEHVRLVDDYRGQGVPEGSKSITLALRFRAADRTLTAAEATEAKLAGVALATERLGATLRD